MHDNLQILFDSYIALTAASTVTGLATYIYGVNKAYYDGESRLESKKLTRDSKKMVKNLKSYKRELVIKESLKTFIPIYNVYNSVTLFVARDKLYELYKDHFEDSFENINDNERMSKYDADTEKAIQLILKKRKK